MNKVFKKEVLKLLPEYSYANPFFYKGPVNHILCGFCYNKVPSGLAWIHGGAYPLYSMEKKEHLSLSLSFTERLCWIETKGISDKTQASVFVKRIQAYQQQVSLLQDLRYFTKVYAPSQPLNDREIIRRHIYVLNMIMLGEEEEAKRHLGLLLNSEYIAKDERTRKIFLLDDVSEALSKGIDNAKNLLLNWEQENKRNFDIR